MHLGGWLRLWVVLVVLYGLVVAGFTVMLMPTERELSASWASEALQILASDIEEHREEDLSLGSEATPRFQGQVQGQERRADSPG
jgi:hypothetical protein